MIIYLVAMRALEILIDFKGRSVARDLLFGVQKAEENPSCKRVKLHWLKSVALVYSLSGLRHL